MSASPDPAPRSPKEIGRQMAELLFRGLLIIERDNPDLSREQAAAVLRRRLEEGS